MPSPPVASAEFYHWLYEVEDIISTAVQRCSPRNWDEDHISRTWLQELVANQSSIAVGQSSGSPFSVAWDAYKADGPLEEAHGDIVFLVRCSFREGQELEGVGFLEAKRIYPASGGYDALNWEQLHYQSACSSNHHLLLYDFAPIYVAAHNLMDQGFCRACTAMPYGAVRAAVVPTRHAIALHRRSRNLHALSTPLSYQICCRYLRGLDLDWSADLVRAVRAGAVPNIRFLFVAHSLVGIEGTPSVDNFEINREHFRPIDPGENLVYDS